jgi:hypothetical protein
MTIRFFRRVRIIPGLRINLSKSGASLSVGRRGAWYTVGPRGTRTTIGAPGTGLFWTEQHRGSPALQEPSPTDPNLDRSRGANLAMGLFLVVAMAVLVAMIVFAG